MADTDKVFMIPDNTGNHLDPNALLAMMNNNGCGNGNWMWIIFLFFLYGWGRNGNGLFGNNSNGDGTSYLASQAERDMLMLAINGNGQAIQSLTGYLNTDLTSIQNAICNVKSTLENVGGLIGLTGQQVINAVQSGNLNIASLIAQCCCENKLLVTTMGYEGLLRDLANTAAITSRIDLLSNGIQTGFATTAYEASLNACDIKNGLRDQTQTILNKLSDMESSAKDDKITTLTAQLTAANSRAERANELAPIIAQLNAIKANLPATTTVLYPQLTAVPNYVAYGYNNYNSGFWG